MGGEIVLHSTEGVGSEFVFTVCLHVATEKRDATRPVLQTLASDEIPKPCMLVVDDNNHSRAVIESRLAEWTVSTVALPDAESAYEYLAESVRGSEPLVDAVLIDPRDVRDEWAHFGYEAEGR